MTVHDPGATQTELPAVHEAWLPREHSLHRPRHGGRQVTALISALVFFTAPAFMWLFGMRSAEIENHRLAEFPSVAAGWGFFTGLNPWATDNLPFRQDAVLATDWISRTFFGEPAPFDQGGNAPSGPLPGTPGTPDGYEPAEPGDPSDGGYAGYRRVIEGNDGWLYLGYDTVAKCRPHQPLTQTIRQLKKLREAVRDSGRTFVLVPVPDKTTMVPEHLPETYSGEECASEVTPVLWRELNTVADAVDLRPMLQAMGEELGRPPYYPLDSHWTHEGALTMVRALADRLEPGMADTWRLEEKSRYTGSADLPRMIGKQGENEAITYRLMPDGETDRTDDGVGDLSKPVRRTSEPLPGMFTAPTIYLGDSFANAASSYLPAMFSDITMLSYTAVTTDPRMVAETVADHEVVVVQVAERNIASGTAPMLEQSFIDVLKRELAARPIR